jgi:Fe-S-cluster-containing hydrogenase component 2
MSAGKSGAAPSARSGLPGGLLAVVGQEAPFAALGPQEQAALLGAAELRAVGPTEALLPPIDPKTFRRVEPISAVFVLEGMCRVHADIHGLDKTLNYVERRGFFWHLGVYSDEEAQGLQLSAMSPVTALLIPAAALDEAMRGSPRFKAAVLEQVKGAVQQREKYFKDPARARVSSFVIEERLLPTNRVKILRHDLCVECDACYEACASRHGVSRLWPSEVRLGVVSIPDNCHNCHYPTCEPACKFDVLKYPEGEPELQVSHDCVGCQQCAKNCSYGAITMVPFDMIDAAYLSQRSEGARGGRMYSVKCDNCAGYGDLACISACPTGALFQVEGAALLDLLYHLDEKGTNAGVLDQLNPDPIPFYRGLSWWFLIGVSVVASAEVLGYYFFPDWTLTELLNKQGIIDTRVVREAEAIYRYRAGGDLSLLYGYLAGGLALTGQLYRVRKWMGSFGGDLRLWLQMHIITSLLGLVFAFWHLAFNFWNLPGIAWWSFFAAVFSGVLGTYLHTFLPRGISTDELALERLNVEFARLTREIEGFYGSRRDAKLAMASTQKPSGATTITRLQDLKSLGSGGEGEFLTGVFQLLLADMASLKDRDARYRAAAKRAGVTGENKAKLERLLRQRIRLERAIGFYEKLREYSRKWHGMHKAASYIFFIALALHVAFELVW